MNAATGELRERVTIQAPTTSADGQGGVTTTWGTVATVWAKVMPARSVEQLASQKVTAIGDYVVEIQYRTDVTAQQRLSWTPYRGSATVLQVHGVRVSVGRPDRLLLDCGVTE